MTQYDIILTAMINNKSKKQWKATDFQREPYYVGYEASPRMSELFKMYPDLFIKKTDGKFRTLEINWNYKNIDKIIKDYEICKN